ncbi:MAG: glycosyltransferase family 4 protein [Anaerolineae bacterium]|nr:glycosyltransferase family 4 protein [Anaerolineae bacterium]
MIKVLHPITRMIVGGAQENTMLTADYLMHRPNYANRYHVEVVCGPQTGPEGSLIDETRGRGVPLTIMPDLVREISPVKDLAAVRKLTAMMHKGHYDIVHTHSSKAGVIGRIAARRAGVPIIVHTVHGWSFHERMSPLKRQVYVLLERLGARYSDAVIVVSPRDITKGLAQGIGRNEQYVVIRSGIELERFGHPQVSRQAMRLQLGIPADVPVIGSVTRLSPQKAPLDMVEAFGRIHATHPDTWFLIVGDGSLRPEVEHHLARLGIAGQTVLTGLRRDVPELMAAMDLFVLSSLWEGLPRVLPQAMATGLPIVCTAADGSAEAVSDGINGFLSPPARPDLLAARLDQLLQDAQLRSRFGCAGLERAPEFGAARMVAAIDTLYCELLAT